MPSSQQCDGCPDLCALAESALEQQSLCARAPRDELIAGLDWTGHGLRDPVDVTLTCLCTNPEARPADLQKSAIEVWQSSEAVARHPEGVLYEQVAVLRAALASQLQPKDVGLLAASRQARADFQAAVQTERARLGPGAVVEICEARWARARVWWRMLTVAHSFAQGGSLDNPRLIALAEQVRDVLALEAALKGHPLAKVHLHPLCGQTLIQLAELAWKKAAESLTWSQPWAIIQCFGSATLHHSATLLHFSKSGLPEKVLQVVRGTSPFFRTALPPALEPMRTMHEESAADAFAAVSRAAALHHLDPTEGYLSSQPEQLQALLCLAQDVLHRQPFEYDTGGDYANWMNLIHSIFFVVHALPQASFQAWSAKRGLKTVVLLLTRMRELAAHMVGLPADLRGPASKLADSMPFKLTHSMACLVLLLGSRGLDWPPQLLRSAAVEMEKRGHSAVRYFLHDPRALAAMYLAEGWLWEAPERDAVGCSSCRGSLLERPLRLLLRLLAAADQPPVAHSLGTTHAFFIAYTVLRKHPGLAATFLREGGLQTAVSVAPNKEVRPSARFFGFLAYFEYVHKSHLATGRQAHAEQFHGLEATASALLRLAERDRRAGMEMWDVVPISTAMLQLQLALENFSAP